MEWFMHMIKRIAPTLVLAAAVFFANSAWAGPKPKKNFAQFKGSYTGPGTVTSAADPVYKSGFGNVKVKIQVPKNGKSATLTFSGLVVLNAVPTPYGGTISLAGGVATFSDMTFARGQGTVYPGTGAYTNTSAKSFIFTGTDPSTGATISGSAKVSPSGKTKQKVQFQITAVTPANTLTFGFSPTGKPPVLPK